MTSYHTPSVFVLLHSSPAATAIMITVTNVDLNLDTPTARYSRFAQPCKGIPREQQPAYAAQNHTSTQDSLKPCRADQRWDGKSLDAAQQLNKQVAIYIFIRTRTRHIASRRWHTTPAPSTAAELNSSHLSLHVRLSCV
jgi:hypothetical protein